MTISSRCASAVFRIVITFCLIPLGEATVFAQGTVIHQIPDATVLPAWEHVESSATVLSLVEPTSGLNASPTQSAKRRQTQPRDSASEPYRATVTENVVTMVDVPQISQRIIRRPVTYSRQVQVPRKIQSIVRVPVTQVYTTRECYGLHGRRCRYVSRTRTVYRNEIRSRIVLRTETRTQTVALSETVNVTQMRSEQQVVSQQRTVTIESLYNDPDAGKKSDQFMIEAPRSAGAIAELIDSILFRRYPEEKYDFDGTTSEFTVDYQQNNVVDGQQVMIRVEINQNDRRNLTLEVAVRDLNDPAQATEWAEEVFRELKDEISQQ